MVKLAPLQPEHVAHFYTWLRDPEVIEYSLSAFQRLKTTEQIDQWFAATLQQANTLNFGIYWEDTNALIGYAGLSGISATNQSGEYFIFIGEKALWGKGVGTAVTKQIVHLGFTRHHLNRIMLTVFEPNTGGLKAYTKAGFVVEGRLRQAACRHGVFHDKLVMSVLKAEWQPQGAAGY
ncbi:GNAT family N-acetyltransferase [Hymenobacter sp. PAMC 26628]|uniref:GNAT family N-acetyltransferase n=1 Tax=Hymenobacter sp. PAMC 26628 TaxID=1484118 RepID=UPI0007704416|nr:GNAT family protein [Hymenobacter sp. PAMC 26628]AMJ65650.1 GCN5 family acetyltransferase [Hymenobacter sp. PAMC 26628]